MRDRQEIQKKLDAVLLRIQGLTYSIGIAENFTDREIYWRERNIELHTKHNLLHQLENIKRHRPILGEAEGTMGFGLLNT